MNRNGIGLGLVIANKLVNEFEGEMSFESTAGIGSEFTFTIKLIDNQEAV
jgi:signal transduction histidine kinase